MAKAVKMNKRDLEKFKKILLKKREDLISEMNNITKDTLSKSQREASGDLSGYSFHMADQASDNYDREFSLNLASDNQKVIFAIDEALGRIKDKSYGRCSKCNKAITRKRLQAVPYAVLCIDCQRKEEAKPKAS
ncbi:MAG: TraR/DksA C4-type zinc finger protein [Candidatus Omnitrophota bacterium]|nr:MAG: TraR/DksA C4-type zinc finger protein [Candidatus Omnitrophota bacterium]